MGLFSGKYNPLRGVKEGVSSFGSATGLDNVISFSPIRPPNSSNRASSPVAPVAEPTNYAETFLPENASTDNDIKPIDIDTPGLDITSTETGLDITRDPELEALLTTFGTNLDDAVKKIDTLIANVTPGSGQLTKAIDDQIAAAKAELETDRRRNVGNLQDNFARRRLSGSSFAADAISRAEAEFAEKEARIDADAGLMKSQAFLQELDISSKLIAQKSALDAQKVLTNINQLNFESQTGVQVAQMINQINTANAQLDQQLNLAIAEINAGRQNLLDQLAIQREIAQMQAKAQERSAIFGGLGQLAGLGIGLALTGGNPVGALVGAQAGSSLSNIFMPSGGGLSLSSEGFLAVPGTLSTSPGNVNFLAQPGDVTPLRTAHGTNLR